jgi:hypothetical protein
VRCYALKDSYQEFLEELKINKEDFFQFGLNKVIYIDNEKVRKNWDNLKSRVLNNGEVFIRGYGRDAKGTDMFIDLYKHMFRNNNIRKDGTNNQRPTKLIEELTGYKKRGAKCNIRNYQVSHIFGRTKNPYCFTAPWNIVYIPKIVDPFTGHEAQGPIAQEFFTLFKQQSMERFKEYIDEFNEIVTSELIQEKFEEYINLLETSAKKIDDEIEYKKTLKAIERFKKDFSSEFSPIT